MVLSVTQSAKSFLKTAKRLIFNGKMTFVSKRMVFYDNKWVSAKQALVDLNIMSIKQLWNYVLELEASDCIDISHDHDLGRDFNDDMYEFLKIINGIKVYIKLTIDDRGVLCLSFHKSRY